MAIYYRLTDDETGVVHASPSVEAFFTEVIAIFGDLAEENPDDPPWTSSLYRTPECVIANISYTRCKEVAPELLRLAHKHGLTMFDPQTSEVHHPSER